MNGRPLLLDTCACIWLANGDPLSDLAMEAMRESLATTSGLAVSPITAWEIGLLTARNRISLTSRPEAWFRLLMGLPGLRLAEMDPDILIASSYLPGSAPADPADRIIATTARERNYRLVTRDRQLLDYGEQGHVDVIVC